jgi:hypothetical protein
MAKKTAPKSVTLTEAEITLILADASWLESKLAAREMKYLRSLNRFVYNGSRNESIRQVYTYPTNYLFQGVDDGRTGPLPSINIGRSMALTLQSKLIQTKGRVFFTAVNGLWDTIKTCRNAQVFFDAFVERDELNDKVKKSVLDALIFEAGYIWVDDESKSTIRIHPWQYFADQAEVTYGKMSRVMIVQDWHPVLPFKDRLPKGGKCATALEKNPHITAKVVRYFDLERKIKSLFIAGEYIDSVELMSDRSPVVPIYYNDPVKGMYSNSIMDNSRQNQNLIDEILRRVRDAAILSPANTIFVPSTPGSNANDSVIKTLDALVGNVVKYDPTLGLPTVATPPPIDPAYVQLLEFIKDQSFDQEGISQLTAQSKVPEDVTSGVALDTLQDIQSTRFQTQVDNLIQFYKNIYTTMIDVFPEDDDILPPRLNRSNVKWSEIKRQRELYSLSSSLTSMLSKEPKVKMEQIEKLQAQKIINPNQAAQLLEIPDLESAYSVATASYDNCRKIIERAIDQQKFDFYNVVDLNMLLGEAVNTLLQLDSVDEDPRVLENLVTLINIVVQKQADVRNAQNPALPPPVAPPGPLKDQLLDGSQIVALTSVLKAVKAGEIDTDMASGLIAAVDPSIPQPLLLKMLGLPPLPEAPPVDNAPTAPAAPVVAQN